METENRESGISFIGKIPWGTHFCHFYETKQDLLDILIPYFRTGLENNEFCLWVVSDPVGEEAAIEALRQAVPKADQYLAAGRIEIVPHTSFLSSRQVISSTGRIEIVPSVEWYLKDGAFVSERVIKGWNEKLVQALAEGYAGMRVNANESWLTQENWNDFAEYEKTLDETLANRRMIVLCSYPLSSASATEIFDVVQSHQIALLKRRGNWEVVESPELKQAKAEIKRLNEQLEQRIAERTRELEAANKELREEIAERKRAEEKLRQTQERMESILASVSDTHILFDRQWHYLYVNQAAANAIGVPREQILGRTLWELFPDIIGTELEHQYRRAMEQRVTTIFDFHYLSRDQWWENRFYPISKGLAVFGSDITARKRAEEEMNRQAARAETLARIAARLNKQLDLDTVVHAVCQEAVDTFKVSQATMSLYDKKRDLLVYAGGVNIPTEYAATIEPITRARFDDFLRAMGPIMVVPDIQSVADAPNFEFSSHLDVRTVVTAAMLREQELVGVLVLGVNGHMREFSKDELTLLKAISDQAAQAIANALLLKAANEQHEQLRTLSAKLVEAQEAERRSIARELHDEIGQALTAAKLNLQSISQRPGVESETPIAETIGIIDKVVQQVRSLSLDLRPSMLDDLGLVPALRWYIDRQAQLGRLIARFSPEAMEVAIPLDIQIACFRIAQGALTNVIKHAQAKHVFVELRQVLSTDGSVALELVVRDDGRGFDSAAAFEKAARGASMGLLNMRERAQLLGGQFEIISSLKSGTVVRATFPLKGHSP